MPPVCLDVPPDIPDANADAIQIGHVLANLVDNARRYGGTGSLTIRARPRQGAVVITVEDSGPGIPPAERARVFDRLYRGGHARELHPDGRGLGLHVCRRLVEAHGGQIWIEPDSVLSAISFSLPTASRGAAPGQGRA